MPFNGYQNALVTGASSGIGAATAKALAGRGLTVHVVARRKDRLEKLGEESGCIPHVLDLRNTDAIYDEFGDAEIDIVVNNAGVGRGFEELYKVDRKDIDTTAATNVNAVIHVLRAVMPGMVARRRGHIVNLGSIGGLYPVHSSLYGATKGAVHLLSQNLRMELSGTGVRLTEICPGRVESEFFHVAVPDPEERKSFTTGIKSLQPQDVADAIVYALGTPLHVNVSLIELTPTEQAPGGVLNVSTNDD